MATMHCALCDRPVEARRHIGIGTVALGFVTGGLWLLAIPFYARRCSICRSDAVSAVPATPGASRTASGPAAARIADLQQRLTTTLDLLEAANAQIDRLRTEQDFYRQLLGDRIPEERRRLGGS